jgi:Flp pilus assembly pilin Flp
MHKRRVAGGVRGERGQAMVEYAIVTALIAVVAMVAVQALGVGITGVFNNIVQSITSV